MPSEFSAAGDIRVNANHCQSEEVLERGDPRFRKHNCLAHGTAADLQVGCRRPVWGDGVIDGRHYGLCSRCWHRWMMFDRTYYLLQPNPASKLFDPRNAAQMESLCIGVAHEPPALTVDDLEAMWGDDDLLPFFPDDDEDDPYFEGAA